MAPDKFPKESRTDCSKALFFLVAGENYRQRWSVKNRNSERSEMIMKCKLLIAILILVSVVQPWLSVNGQQMATVNEDFSIPLPVGDNPSRFHNEVKNEAGGVFVADNPVRRLEFSDSGLRFIPKAVLGQSAENGLHFRLASITSGGLLYLPDADGQSISPAGEGAEVFYSHPFDIFEKFRALDSSVEQSLVFEHPLGLDTDNLAITFQVTTSLEAKRLNGPTRKGITFRYAGEKVLRCGAVKVIDAAQREMLAELLFQDNRLSINISGEWLKGAIYPVTVKHSIEALHASNRVMQSDSDTAGDGANAEQALNESIDQTGDSESVPPESRRLVPSVISGGTPPVPGLVLGLRHNVNQEREGSGYMTFFSASANAPVNRMDGGDKGAALHRGYEWWMVRDNPSANPASLRLPPGIALGLKHSQNQSSAGIKVFGRDPYSGPSSFPGFRKQAGGDLGAPSGQGFYWYESTGEGFSDWTAVNNLPKYTVLGLKHSINQRSKKVSWNGRTYDPANSSIAPPAGFVRKVGGDWGAPSGQGYCWYEKVTGFELVAIPTLTVTLSRSLLMGAGDAASLDQDRDSLVDNLEDTIADTFRPYCIFDSHETARNAFDPVEPVTLFQVRPVQASLINGLLIIYVKWVFLFRQDGGYGPASICGNAHPGDNDSGIYALYSNGGSTWTVYGVGLGDKDLAWPTNSRLEVYDLTHPIVYMSASKHHEYFTRDRDQEDSIYSGAAGCNDDVNGLGARVLTNLRSFSSGFYNNVGEPESHPSPRFIDNLSRYYSGHTAWGNDNFYSVDAGPVRRKWMDFAWIR
jgi:hypothetical protein